MSTTAVEFSGLSKKFSSKSGQVVALDDVSASVPVGSIFGVVGTSGAGKSTLIRMVNGLEQPSTGQVTVLGQDVGNASGKQLRELRHDVSMVFQHYNLLATQTVAHNVGMPLLLMGVSKQEREERVAQVLKLVGLADRAEYLPKQLSGGQRQRVGIARALVTNPQILLCDEPTSALDPLTTNQILDLLTQVNHELGITVLIITHEISVIARIADSVAVMEDGHIIEQGSVEEVFAHPKQPLTRKFVETVIPQELPSAVEQEVRSGAYDTVARVVHTGGAAKSLLTDLSTAGVKAALLHASDASLKSSTVGTLVLGLDNAKGLEVLRAEPGITVEVVN